MSYETRPSDQGKNLTKGGKAMTKPTTPYIEYVGDVVVRRHDLDEAELRSIGEFTRENILAWMGRCPHRDWENWIGVLPIEDFHAVCGDVDIPWATEEAKALWTKVRGQ
jgi:hypothetical protein